ncbi:MAG: MFS transporter, partial [Armatimonadetes bacterium]|nr:MFS transporter [Armatimonadota bacterium]
MIKRLWARYSQSYLTYHSLIYLSIVAAVAELAYAVMNQSAIPPYVQEIGLTAHIGLIYAVFLTVETIFKSPMGHLGDRFGRRPLIVAGAIVSSCTALLMTVAKTLWLLLILRAMDGIASAAIWPTMIAAMSGSVRPERRTTAMSALTVVYIGAVALGPLIGGVANDATNSRLTSFYVISALFVITALVAYFLTPRRSREEDEAHEEEERTPHMRDVITGVKAVPDMMLLAFMAFFAIGLLIPIVKLFAMNELGMSETGYGGLIFPIAIAVAGASLVAGRLGDKWGKVPSVRLGIALASAAMWAVAFSRTPWHLAGAGVFLGIGFVIAMPAWLALVSDMAAPWIRGAVIGALGTAQGFGAVIGAALGSYLYERAKLSVFGISFSPHYS